MNNENNYSIHLSLFSINIQTTISTSIDDIQNESLQVAHLSSILIIAI